jgi:hypothetical protein
MKPTKHYLKEENGGAYGNIIDIIEGVNLFNYTPMELL